MGWPFEIRSTTRRASTSVPKCPEIGLAVPLQHSQAILERPEVSPGPPSALSGNRRRSPGRPGGSLAVLQTVLKATRHAWNAPRLPLCAPWGASTAASVSSTGLWWLQAAASSLLSAHREGFHSVQHSLGFEHALLVAKGSNLVLAFCCVLRMSTASTAASVSSICVSFWLLQAAALSSLLGGLEGFHQPQAASVSRISA